MRLENLSVTLVGPEFPINVGYAARLIKNFGVKKLYLVEPNFDRRVAAVYAAHGADIIQDAEQLDFDALRNRHDLLVATTAVTAARRANINRSSVSPEEAAGYISSSASASLVFGRDTTGLRNEELAKCDLVTSINTGTGYRTLNVSHSMGIMLYILSKHGTEHARLPDLGSRDAFAAYAYELALASGVEKHRAERLRRIAKRVALSSQLDGRDIGLLVSLLRRASRVISEKDS